MWLIDVLRGGTTRFTVDAAIDQAAIWSSDGTQIAFSSIRRGSYDLYVKPSSGAGAEELLLESPQAKVVEDWSADGKFVLTKKRGCKRVGISGPCLWLAIGSQ